MNISDYKYKTELHAHSKPASGCADLPPESVVRIYSEIGYTSLVLTNHFNPDMRFYDDKEKAVKSYLRDYYVAKEYGEKYGINVILGCEIRFLKSPNDYLLFGIDEDLLYDAFDMLESGIAEFSKWFRNDSRLIVQAHPLRNGSTPAPIEFLDGIEAFNMHPKHNSCVSLSAKLAKEHNLIITCGTDFHHNHHEGMISLLTKKPMRNSFELEKTVRSRDYLFEISGNIIVPYGYRESV